MSSKMPSARSQARPIGGTDSLTSRFVEAAMNHGEATEAGDRRTTNKAYKRYDRARRQLLLRGHEGREVIRKLMMHENGWVRLAAASTSLGFDTKMAEEVLTMLEKEPGFLGHDAKWVLKEWKAGHRKAL